MFHINKQRTCGRSLPCTHNASPTDGVTTPCVAAARSISAGHGLHRPVPATLPPDRRGRLKNGNRCGDFLAAPRCGARTRCARACGQPAMRNGRCRLHGGLSTGPRTPEGLARCRRARWRHGGRSAQVRALLREARTHLRRARALRARVVGSPAGHRVHRSKSNSSVGAPPCGRPLGAADGRPHGAAPTPGSTVGAHLRSSAASTPSSAGHGVHRSVSTNTLPRGHNPRRQILLSSIAPLLPPDSASLPLCVSAVNPSPRWAWGPRDVSLMTSVS